MLLDVICCLISVLVKMNMPHTSSVNQAVYLEKTWGILQILCDPNLHCKKK